MNNQLLNVPVEAQPSANGIVLVAQTSRLAPSKSTILHDKGSDPEKPKNWKKPKDMPRRPLSAYNLFFQSERLRMISVMTNENEPASRYKRRKAAGIGFAGMARSIASKWKIIPSADKSVFQGQARIEKARYHKEIVVWRLKQQPAKKGPTKKNLPLKEEAPLKAPTSVTTAVVGLDETTPSDTSGVTDHYLPTLVQGMKDTLLTQDRQKLYRWNAMADMGRAQPLPILQFDTLSNGSQPMWSIVHSFDITPDDTRQKVRRSSLRENTPEESGVASSAYEPLPDSYWCWEEALAGIHFES